MELPNTGNFRCYNTAIFPSTLQNFRSRLWVRDEILLKSNIFLIVQENDSEENHGQSYMSQAVYCLCVRFNIECQVLMSAGHLMLERPFNVESSVCVKLAKSWNLFESQFYHS